MRSSSNVQCKKLHMVIVWCASWVSLWETERWEVRWGRGDWWGEGETQARARDQVIQQSKYWQVCARSCPFKMSSERAATNISFYYLLLLLTIRPSRFVHVFIYSHTICNALFFFIRLHCTECWIVVCDLRGEIRWTHVKNNLFAIFGRLLLLLSLSFVRDGSRSFVHPVSFTPQRMQQRALHARQIYNNKCLAETRSIMWENQKMVCAKAAAVFACVTWLRANEIECISERRNNNNGAQACAQIGIQL